MVVLHVNPIVEDERFLQSLYRGELTLFTGLTSVEAFVTHVREQLDELFRPHDPQQAHLHFEPADMAAMLGRWKPSFIHDERSYDLLLGILREIGLKSEHTYVDLPKPRTSFPIGHLTTGIAYAFPWHRDVWYGAPPQQINWWLPIYELSADNAMRFDLQSFAAAVRNDSDSFDYYAVNRARLTTATQVTTERQSRPQAVGHTAADEFVPLPPPGSVLAFSGAQLHATIPNTSGRSRYSVDFRTVDRRHVEQGVGAPTVDARCTGTALRDFVGADSGERIEEPVVQRLYGAPPDDAILVFDKEISQKAAAALAAPTADAAH